MAKILSVGLDASLLETRHKVLRLTGAEVISARPELAFRLIEEQEFGLVLICHTVPEDVCVRLCRALDRCCPEIPIVLLEGPAVRALPGSAKARGFDWQRGPGALVELAKGLLSALRPTAAEHPAMLSVAQAA